MHPYITIGFWFFLGAYCGYLAHKKGKNPYFWFFIGLFFGLLGILLLYFVAARIRKLKKQQEIRQTPLVLSSPPLPASLKDPTTLWYYLDQKHQQNGPVTFTALKNEMAAGTLSHLTYVWEENMDKWKQIKDVPILLEETAVLSSKEKSL